MPAGGKFGVKSPAESQQLDTVWMNLPGDIPHLVSVPCPCASRACPSSERRRPGAGREAGSYQGDAIREITGQTPLSRMGSLRVGDNPASGALALRVDPLLGLLGTNGDTSFNMYGELSISAARVVPTADENRPANVALPVALYLGIPA